MELEVHGGYARNVAWYHRSYDDEMIQPLFAGVDGWYGGGWGKFGDLPAGSAMLVHIPTIDQFDVRVLSSACAKTDKELAFGVYEFERTRCLFLRNADADIIKKQNAARKAVMDAVVCFDEEMELQTKDSDLQVCHRHDHVLTSFVFAEIDNRRTD